MYHNKISKIVDEVTTLDSNGLNPHIYEIEDNLNYLKSELDSLKLSISNVKLENQPVESTVPNNRVVYFNGVKWDVINSLNPVGELLQKYPAGLYLNNIIYLSGLATNLDNSIIDNGIINVGVPYYLSIESGKITTIQPQASIYIGVFLNATTFLLNIQFMTNSHNHKRILLTPSEWIDNGTSINYPLDKLGQLPMPYNGLTLVFDSKYIPYYGSYTVDYNGITLLDLSYFDTLLDVPLGSGTFDIISISSYKIEAFWSNPKTMSIPGVTSLTSETNNLVISGTNNLRIKNVPIVETKVINKSGNTVVKDITVSPTTGNIELHKGTIITTQSNSTNLIKEDNFHEIFLQGALSKIYQNSVATYIEFPYQRKTAAIFKYCLPDNVDVSKPINVNIVYSGLLNQITSIPINVYRTILSIGEFLSESSILSVKSLPIYSGIKLEKMILLQLPYEELRERNIIFIKIERNIDNNYLSGLAVPNLSISYYLK